jgi:hypothetical protein
LNEFPASVEGEKEAESTIAILLPVENIIELFTTEYPEIVELPFTERSPKIPVEPVTVKDPDIVIS